MFNVIRKHLTPSPAAKTGFSALLVPVTAGAVPLKVLLVPLTTGAAPLSTLFAPLNTGPVFPATIFIVSLTALYVLTPTATVQAAVTHEFLPGPSAEITKGAPEGQPLPGPVSGLNAMTTDAGHLFLAEKVEDGSGHVRLDEFDDSTGAFVRQFPQDPSLSSLDAGVAVAHASGDVYDAGAAGVAVFGAAGELKATWKGETAGAPFGSLLGVGVDNSTGHWSEGDVLVLNGGEKAVDVLKPEAGGEEPNKLAVPPLTGTCETPGENAEGPTPCPLSKPVPFTEPLAMSVSATNGDLLVADEHEGNIDVVDVFEPAGLDELVFVRRLTGTPSGLWEANFFLPERRQVKGLAADAAGDIYVSEEVLNSQTNEAEYFVDQFDSSGKYLGHLAGTPAAPFHGISSVAVDPSTHRVYVSEGANTVHPTGAVDVFGPSIVVPDVTTEPADPIAPHGATLNGTVNPDGEGEATCAFAWGSTAALSEPPLPCEPETVPNVTGPVPVKAELTGLQPDTTYFYRLQATNHNATNPGEPGQTREFTTSGPGIHSTSTTSATADTALLQAAIDPHGAPTTFHFEYDTSPYAEGEPHHGASLPLPDQALGSGQGDVEVLQPLAGLAPGTTYHYRVVARSELQPGVFEEFDGPDRTFITQTGGATGLPDDRAWELVSPPEKHGAALVGITASGFIQAAAGGGSIVYRANLSVTGRPQGNIDQMQVLATRGSGGWSSADLEVPHLAPTQILPVQEYRLFSSDLSRAALQPSGSFNPSLSPLAAEQTPYLRDLATGTFTPLVTTANDTTEPLLPFGEEVDGECQQTICGPGFLGATPDLSYAVLGQWEHSGVVPLLAGAAEGSLYEWSSQTGALSLVSELPGNAGSVAGTLGHYEHAISDNGSRVFWAHEGSLYMRDMVRGETIQIGTGRQDFEGANAAGTLVFYSHHECEVTLGSGTGELECRPLGEDGLLLGTSEDGTWVYYEKGGALFVRHDGATKLIASELGTFRGIGLASGGPQPQEDPWRVSSDGEWFAFMSDRSLTGYDNRDAKTGVPDEEVYLYGAAAERLICASCDPTGARPHGIPWQERSLANDAFTLWPAGTTIAASIPGGAPYALAAPPLYQPRSLSNGGRLFFDSSDDLVPRDSNAQSDVYEFEPVGDGSCTAGTASGSEVYVAVSGGCVGLISSGTSALESAFLDASESGDDVFFLTAEKLSTRDSDNAYDLYDARVGGQESEEIKPVECQGDACQQPVVPPDDATPASLAGAGAGNLVAPAPVVVKPKAKTAAQIRAGKLAKALKVCRRDKSKKRRSTCEKRARRTYGKGK